jgi:HEAT repeat protein
MNQRERGRLLHAAAGRRDTAPTRLLTVLALALAVAGCSAQTAPTATSEAEFDGATPWELASLGPEARPYVMKGLYDPNTGGESVGALASYNDLEALHELGKLVLDASYPHREVAVRSFTVTAGLWQEAAEPYWLALMADETIDVVDHCLRHIESDHPTNAATLLAPLRADDDPGGRERAEWAYTYFVEQGDSGGREGIEIRVALGREEYAYDDDITLTVTLVNSGEIPASVNTSLFYSPNHIPEHLKLELVTPDGNVYTYPNHGFGPSIVPSSQKLQPGDSVSKEIDIQGHCRPAQPGVYRVTVSYGSMAHFIPGSYVVGLPPLLVSDTLEFVLRRPSRAYVDDLLAEIAPDTITDERVFASESAPDGHTVVNRKRRDSPVYRSIHQPLYELGPLRDPKAVATLRALVRLPQDRPDLELASSVAWSAMRALAHYDTPDPVPMCIRLLGDRDDFAERRLAELGGPTAMEALRAHAVGSRGGAAAKALTDLGDPTVLRAMQDEALNGTAPDDESKWRRPKVWELLLPGETLMDRLHHAHPAVRSQALWTARKEGRVDVLAAGTTNADPRIRRQAIDSLSDGHGPMDEPGEHTLRIDALKRALTDADPHIRSAAAKELANQGDDTGENQLRTDLYAIDSKTRRAAREALRQLRQLRRSR